MQAILLFIIRLCTRQRQEKPFGIIYLMYTLSVDICCKQQVYDF